MIIRRSCQTRVGETERGVWENDRRTRAVSYTHLDVYKRQVSMRIPFTLHFKSCRRFFRRLVRPDSTRGPSSVAALKIPIGEEPIWRRPGRRATTPKWIHLGTCRPSAVSLGGHCSWIFWRKHILMSLAQDIHNWWSLTNWNMHFHKKETKKLDCCREMRNTHDH